MSEVVVGVKLKADGSGLVGEVKISEKAWQDLKKEAAAAGTSMEKAGESGKTAAKQTTSAVNESSAAWQQARNIVLGYISATQAISIAREFLAQSDAMTLVNARLRQATTTAEEFRNLQKDLYATAQRLGVGYLDLAASTAKLAVSVKALGGNASDAARLAEILIATARIGGQTTQEAASSAQQFAQAMGSGVLQGDELKSILENNQQLALALAAGLGVAQGQLKKMGEEGKLTSEVVGNALMGQYEKIREASGRIPQTYEAGLQRMKNASAQTVASINDTYQITQTLGEALSVTASAADQYRIQASAAAGSPPVTKETSETAALLARAMAVVLGVVEALGGAFVLVGKAIAIGVIGAVGFAKAMTRDFSGAKESLSAMVEGWKDIGNSAIPSLGAIGTRLAAVNAALDDHAAKQNAAAAGSNKFAAATGMATQRFDEATKGVKTAITIQEEYNKDITKAAAAFTALVAAMQREGKSQADIDAAGAKYAQFAKQRNIERLADLRALSNASSASFEQQVAMIRATMAAEMQAAEFSAKLRDKERSDAAAFEDFKQQMGLQSAEQTLAAKLAIDQQGYEAQLQLLRLNLDKQEAARAAVEAKRVTGQQDIERKKKELADIDKEILKTGYQMVTVIEEQNSATNKGVQAVDLLANARKKELLALTRSTEDIIRGYAEQADAQQFQITLIGKSAAEVARLTELRRIDAEIVKQVLVLNRAIEDAVNSGKSAQQIQEIYDKHNGVLSVLAAQRDIMPQIAAGIVTNRDETQKWLDLYRTLDSAFQSAITSILNGTKSTKDAIRDLGRTIRDELIKALYEATVKKWVVNIVANMVGGSTGSAILNAATGSNGILGNILGASSGGSALASIGGAAAAGLNYLGLGGASQFVGGLTGAIAGPALPGSALAIGQSIGGAIAAAGPFIAIAAALYGINQFLNSRRGGDKEGGSYLATYGADGALTGVDSRRFYDPRSMDAQFTGLATGVANSFFTALRRYGATATGATFGIGGDTDPRGTAQSRVSGVSWVNGREVYYNQGRDIGRDSSRYGAEYELEAKRMLAAALKAAFADSETVAKPIKDLFAAFKVEGSTLEDINKLLSAAETIQQIIDALATTGISGLDYDALVGFQREGESLTDTFTRVTSAVANFNDMFTTSAEKENTTIQSFRTTMTDLGLTIPDTAEGFRSLVRGLDLSTAAGRDTFDALMAAAPAARTYYDVIERGAQQAADAAAEAIKEAARVAEEALQKLRDRIAAVQSFIASLGDDMFNIRSAQPGFDAVGYWGDQVNARRTAFNAATTTEDRLETGGRLRQAILSRRDAQRAEAQRDHDTRIAAINQERDLMRAAGEERIKNERAALDAAKQAAQQLKEAYKAIGDFAKSLLLSDYSPLTDRQKLDESSSQYSSIAARARNGDLSAVGQFTGSANAYLKELKNYYAVSSDEYQREFNRIRSEAESLGLKGDAMDLSAYEAQALALDREQNELDRQLAEFDAMTAAADADLQARMLEIDQEALDDLQALSDSLGTHLTSLQDTLDEQLRVTRQNGESVRAVESAVRSVEQAITITNAKSAENAAEIITLREQLVDALSRLGRRVEAVAGAGS